MSDGLHFVHVGITVSDLQRSAAFYELLGFRRDESLISLGWEDFIREKNALYRLEEGAHASVLYMNREEGVSLELFEFNDQLEAERAVWNRPGIHHIALRCGNLDEVYEKLVKAGVQIALPPVRGKRQAFLFACDPDGNYVEVAQPYV